MSQASALPFKQRFTLEERKKRFGITREQMPDRVHLIVEPAPGSRLQPLEKCLLPCPPNATVGQIVNMIKGKIAMDSPEDALFVFIGDLTPPTSATIGDLYLKHHDADGFLYITYKTEATFG